MVALSRKSPRRPRLSLSGLSCTQGWRRSRQSHYWKTSAPRPLPPLLPRSPLSLASFSSELAVTVLAYPSALTKTSSPRDLHSQHLSTCSLLVVKRSPVFGLQ